MNVIVEHSLDNNCPAVLSWNSLCQDSFVTLLGRRKKFEASILEQTKRKQSDFLRKEESNAEKFRQLILTGGILNLSSSVDSRIPNPANMRDAIRTDRKPRNGSYTYWKNLPIGHSHFHTEIMLKITEHTSPSETGINFHYND